MEMDAGTPSKKAKTSAAAGATPQKPWKASPADQILTPEKLTQRVTAAAPAAEEADEIESLERELGVGAGAGQSPVKRKAEVKLPERYRSVTFM